MQILNSDVTPKIYRAADISARFGISKSYIYQLTKTGKFPKPFNIIPGGSSKGWDAKEIDDWFAARMEDRSNGGVK